MIAPDSGAQVIPLGVGEAPRVPDGTGGGSGLAWLPLAVLAACGVGLFANGFYGVSRWGMLSIAVCAAVAWLVAARSRRLPARTLVALGGLSAWVAWSGLSMTWAESVDRAWLETNRAGLALVIVAGTALAVRTRRQALQVVGTLGSVVALLALYLTARLIVGDAGGLFLEARLNEPLGYINGMAGVLLLGTWPALGLAERGRSPALRGLGLGAAVLIGSMAVLTQSRAVLPVVIGAAAVLLTLVPGRLRRAWLLVAFGGAVAAAAPWLLDVFASRSVAAGGAVPGEAVLRSAGLATATFAVGAGLLWAAANAFVRPTATIRRAATVGLVGLALAATIAAAVAVEDPVGTVRNQYDQFTALKVDTDVSTRFTDASGFRYELWRVAANEFADHPLAGTGAGNYAYDYFRERRITEPVRQPHSLPLQLLAELGLIGLLCLGCFVVPLVLTIFRPGPAMVVAGSPGLIVGAGGAFLVWLFHTSVDWLYNIPAVSGLAFVAAGVLLAGSEPRHRPASDARPTRPQLTTMLVVVVLVFLAVSAARQLVAAQEVSNAQKALPAEPAKAIERTGVALQLNPEAMEAYYARSAAFARLGDYAAARGTLLAALRREPRNFVTWALLGDLHARAGKADAARRAYDRALELNPQEPELRRLVESGVSQ